MSYQQKDSEDGVTEFYHNGELIAFINKEGTVQAAHGKASQKPGLLKWMEKQTPSEDQPGQPQPLTEYEKEVIEETVEDQTTVRAPEQPINPIICPIIGAPNMGDKDPAVIAWWQENHPEEFKNRYAGRRFQSASGIIV